MDYGTKRDEDFRKRDGLGPKIHIHVKIVIYCNEHEWEQFNEDVFSIVNVFRQPIARTYLEFDSEAFISASSTSGPLPVKLPVKLSK